MPWLVLIAGAGIVAFIAYDRHATCVALIEGELMRHHATQIVTAFDWTDFDRDNFTYDVEYVDATGEQCHARCKVRSRRIPEDNAVFWEVPL